MAPPPPLPADHEAERLRVLHALRVLDTAPEPLFDSIARLASQVCGTPIALLSLVDGERQWFKANVGLDGVSQTPRAMAFCAHAIGGDALFEVGDATIDPRFASNPLVTGDPSIRFYAGAPLALPGGQRVGTLCVIDRVQRQLEPAQAALLQALAAIATQALQMRRDLIERLLASSSDYERALQDSRALLLRTGRVAGVGGWQLDLVRSRLNWSEQTRVIHEVGPDFEPTLDNAIAFYTPEARPLIEAAVQHAIQTGEAWDLELPLTTARGRSIWVRAQGEAEFEAGQPVRLVGAFQDITERRRIEQALRDLSAIVEHTPDFVVQTDAQGQLSYMNRAALQATGLAPEAVLSQLNYSDFNTAATQRRFVEEIKPAVEAYGVWVGETTVYGAAMQVLPVSQMVIAHRDEHGRVERYSSVMRDISDPVEARRELQRQASTLNAVAEAMPGVVAVLGRDLRYRYVNSGFESWLGVQRHAVIGRTLAEVLGEEDTRRSMPWVQRVLAGEAVQFERVNAGRQRGRNLLMSYTPLRLDDGVIDGFIGVGQDITEHRQEASRLLELSQRDALTGLYNRAGFEVRIEQEVTQGRGAAMALLYIDLDRFKPVNDDHGHPVGDQLLQQFALRLMALVRPSDFVARLGGDEFAILLFGMREGAHARIVSDKVIAAAQTPFEADGHLLQIGASVGLAFGAHTPGRWHDLVTRADEQLYRAKAAGRGRQAGATDWVDLPVKL